VASQSFPPRITGVQVVPKFNVFLTILPAKKHFFALDDGGKILQAAIEVFDLNFTITEFHQHILEIRKRPQPQIDLWAPQIAARFHQLAQAILAFLQFRPKLDHAFEPEADEGQQRTRFLARIVFFELVKHLHETTH